MRLASTVGSMALAALAASPAFAGYADSPIDLAVNVTSPQQNVFYVA